MNPDSAKLGSGLEAGVFLDEFSKGGGWESRSCCGCKNPILEKERTMRVEFRSDPDGAKGLTGVYHIACGKTFASLAHVINMNPWR